MQASTDVTATIHEAIKLTQTHWRTGARIGLSTTIVPTPPVQADPVLVREALVNLILHAIAAMPEGGILSVRSKKDHNKVYIDIGNSSDTVSHDSQTNLLKDFHAEQQTSASVGLAACRELIEIAGGHLIIENSDDNRRTLTVALPALVKQ